MEDGKAFCVNCLHLVDPETHRDCTLTFDNLVAAEERGGATNFQQNGEAAAVEGSQFSNLSTSQGRNDINNLMNRKPAFENCETQIQQPPKGMSSSRNSSSQQLLESQNPELQTSRNPDYGYSISSFNGDNRIFYEPAPQLYNTFHPVYPHFHTGQNIGQIASSTQEENEIQNAMPQNNERNKFHQEYTQFSYAQNISKNNLPPPIIPSFYTEFRTSTHNEGMNALGQTGYQPNFNYLPPKCHYVPYEPRVTNKISPNHNMSNENCPDNIHTSPISPPQTVIPKSGNISVNKDRNLLAQNGQPSLNLVSKMEMPRKNIAELVKVNRRILKNNPLSAHQKNLDKSAQKNTKKSANKKNKNISHQKTEIRITPQKNVKRSKSQKGTKQSVSKKNEVKNSSEEHLDKNVLQKEAEKKVKGRGITKGVHVKNVEKDTHAEDAQHVHAKNPEQGAHAKAIEQGEKQSAHAKAVEKSAHAKAAVQRAHEKDAVQGAHAEAAVQEAHAKAEMKEVHAIDGKSEQENTGRFTGEGYKSIEEFIEALYNGTLYKRY